MAFLLSSVAALVVWIVVWAITSKGFDSFLITLTLLVVGVGAHVLSRYLPGRRA